MTAAVIQWRFAWATPGDAWEAQWSSLLGQAAAHGAQLVVLPAHTGDALLARQHPTLARTTLTAGLAAAWSPAVDRVTHGEQLRQAYVDCFGRLAAQFGVILAAGSLLLPDDRGILYHQAVVFGADGSILGVQRAAYCSPAERTLGVGAGERPDVVATSIGTLGLVVGEDLYYPEVARLMTLHGAEILVAPTRRRFAGEAGLLAGLWRDVQGNQVFGLEACLLDSDTVPAHSHGACILGPAEMTDQLRGVLAAATTADDAGVVVGELDFDARQQVLDRYDITRYFNHPFYASQLLEVHP